MLYLYDTNLLLFQMHPVVKRSSMYPLGRSSWQELHYDCSVTPQKTVVTLRSPGTSGQYWVVRLTGSTRPVTSGRTGHTQSHSPLTTAVGSATGSGRVSSHAGSRSLYKVGHYWGCLQVSTFTYSVLVSRAETWVINLGLVIHVPDCCKAKLRKGFLLVYFILN